LKLIARLGLVVNCATKECKTPLYIVCQADQTNIELIELLLRHDGIELSPRELQNATPLHLAARLNHIDACLALLRIEDIEVNAKDVEGSIPLHYAARNAHAEVVQLLLARTDVYVNPEDNRWKTPLYFYRVSHVKCSTGESHH
jgi:ankyrin repeat protein